MRVAIYARVSTDDKGQNPENQLRELRAAEDRYRAAPEDRPEPNLVWTALSWVIRSTDKQPLPVTRGTYGGCLIAYLGQHQQEHGALDCWKPGEQT